MNGNTIKQGAKIVKFYIITLFRSKKHMNSPSNKNTPQKAKKPPEIKNSPSINSKDFD
jgi:hypothetical protein